MTYSFKRWKLYEADIKLEDGQVQTVYFFSRWKPKRGKPCDLPNGYKVIFNERTSLPCLEKDIDIELPSILVKKNCNHWR